MEDEHRGLLEVMDFRASIEPALAARAATRITPAELHSLEVAIQSMSESDSPTRAAQLDAEFHSLIARATHNPLLIKLQDLTWSWVNLLERRCWAVCEAARQPSQDVPKSWRQFKSATLS